MHLTEWVSRLAGRWAHDVCPIKANSFPVCNLSGQAGLVAHIFVRAYCVVAREMHFERRIVVNLGEARHAITFCCRSEWAHLLCRKAALCKPQGRSYFRRLRRLEQLDEDQPGSRGEHNAKGRQGFFLHIRRVSANGRRAVQTALA